VGALTDGWDMRSSNVFWTGGEFDPVLLFSPRKDVHGRLTVELIVANATPLYEEQRSQKLDVTAAPRCGDTPPEGEIFGHLLENLEHCYDFRYTLEAVKRPQECSGAH